MGCMPRLFDGFTTEDCVKWELSIKKQQLAQLQEKYDEVYPHNPDPRHFQIIAHTTIGRLTMISVVYPNCTNFKGNKILIYLDTPIKILERSKVLDPHFAEDGVAPIIRLVPTPAGWRMGLEICKLLDKIG
jgi:hypothetical protein